MSGPDCIVVVLLKNCNLELSQIVVKLFNMSGVLLSSFLEGLISESLHSRILKKGLQLKITALLVFFFGKSRPIDYLEKCGLFFISSVTLGLLDQLQIFWLLYLIELLGFLTGLGYSSFSTCYIQGFWQGLACWSSWQT